MFVLYGIIIAVVAAGTTYLLLRPKLKQTQNIDLAIISKNYENQAKYEESKRELNNILEQKLNAEDNLEFLHAETRNIENHNKHLAEIAYDKHMNIMQSKLADSAERESILYQEASLQYQNEYLSILQEAATEFDKALLNKKNEIKTLQIKFDDLFQKTQAAIAANKRQKEIENKTDFYRLILPEEDLIEIKKLKEVAVYLRDKEPLNKVIWKVYYENPTTDLIGRVIGKDIKCGIYKITNLHNFQCYVGQSKNIAQRWRQHIRSGLGAENTSSNNKLYSALMAEGVENFSFEIIEECPLEKLLERELFWQDYFKAKEYGYSIK